MLNLTEEQAAFLMDEVHFGDRPLSKWDTRYERGIVRTCRSVKQQLKDQGITGVMTSRRLCSP